MSQKTQIMNTLVGITLSGRDRRSPCFVQFAGRDLGKPFFIKEKLTVIGRDPRANIRLDEAGVSRAHCRVHVYKDGVMVEDLGSVNGVYVNGHRIAQKWALKDGDLIIIGGATFKYFAPGNIEQLFYDKAYREKIIDAKTGVFNANYLMSTLRAEMEVAHAFSQPLTMMIYDLDHFKLVNDTYGHDFGDDVLKKTAEIVSLVVRKNDDLCRYGGEEFIILLRQTHLDRAVKLAERIRKNVAQFVFRPVVRGKRVMHVQTLSLGVVQLTKKMQSPKDFIKAADKLLYQSKQSGRNQVSA